MSDARSASSSSSSSSPSPPSSSSLLSLSSTAARSSRGLFWTAAILAFIVVLALLVFFPRGAATGEVVAGEGVTVELSDDVTAALVPEIRDLGWRAEYPTRPYEISLHVTIDNESEELFPRWYRVSLYEAGNVVDGEDLRGGSTDTLGTAHIDPGGQATTDFTFTYQHACGEFVAQISYHLTFDGDEERSRVEVPFAVGDEQCLAER